MSNLCLHNFGGPIASVGNYIYIFTNNDDVSRIFKYDITTHTNELIETTIPFATPHTNAVAIGTNIYLVSGANSGTDKQNYKFDTLTNTFTKLADLPDRASASNIGTDGVDVYIYVKTYNSTNNYKCYKYKVAEGTYETLDTATISTVPIIISYSNGYMYLVSANKAYKHDLNANTFEEITSPLKAVYGIKGNKCTTSDGSIAFLNATEPRSIELLHLPTKTYAADSVVIYQGNLYSTQLIMNTPAGTEGRLLNNFIDVWHSTESGLDKTSGLAYGNGTEWVDIR